VGYDAGKRVKGRKIGALVDSEGLPVRVVVRSAAIQDRDGAASSSTNAPALPAARTDPGRCRLQRMKGSVVLPRRWVVERTLSWFRRNRRLAKDFENLAESLATFVTVASIQLALRRLARG
jgi:putative transposase